MPGGHVRIIRLLQAIGGMASLLAAGAAPAVGQDKADPKVWDNYDFVPGSKVIFYTDFSEDKVGNFARRLKFRAARWKSWNATGSKCCGARPVEFFIPVGQKLPERFTLEVDVITPTQASGATTWSRLRGAPRWIAAKSRQRSTGSPDGSLISAAARRATSGSSPTAMQRSIMGQLAHIRVLMDGAYFKMYTNDRRIYNIPELPSCGTASFASSLNGAKRGRRQLHRHIRVAESETDVLYDALAAKGRWATQGILFATGKAELQPESPPVLKEIAATLKSTAISRC